MSGELISIAIAWLVLGAAQELDVRLSERGFSKGFNEGNSWITRIFRTQRPSSLQLRSYNLAWGVVLSLPFLLAHNVQGFGASMGGLIALSITYAQSVLKWRKVLATKTSPQV